MTLRNPFSNPHYLAGGIVARLSVNAATFLWALIVIIKPDTLGSSQSSIAWTARYVHEDLTAAALGALALTQTIWLLAHWPPMRVRRVRVCSIGYGVLAAAWLFVVFNTLLGDRPIPAIATSTGIVMAVLATYAFVNNAVDDDCGRGC